MANPLGKPLTKRAVSVLRAMQGGPMRNAQFCELFGSAPTSLLASAIAAGYVEAVGKYPETLYRLTGKGRAALPPRNPASQKPRALPPMPGGDVRGPSQQRRGARCRHTQ